MSLPDHEPEDGPDAPAETPTRKVPPRGPDPLSPTHRRRMLRALSAAAQNGDVAAQAALIKLSMSAARDAEIADTLRRLKAEGEDA